MDGNLLGQLNADILIVDDTPDNIRFLSAMLLEQGYNVRKALNGQMALNTCQTKPPDLILLDVSMPEMNGYEVCQKLKENPQTQSIPVIFLSALDDVMDKVSAFKVGAVDYITKPFQFEEVLARIQTQLTIRNLQYQLQEQNIQLQMALRDLKATQAQLIHKEKMVGLGQLVAGVAHEINNPISFISGNLTHVYRYVWDLLKLIRLYQENYPNPASPIQQAIADVDLDFLVSDLPKLIGSMRTGVERICTILLALRIFSRLDESAVKLVDIHQGIDSSLLLLQHRIREEGSRPEIKVIKEYGNIPPVACYASQLNQVFLSLLNNAIDAVRGKFGTSPAPQKTLVEEPIALSSRFQASNQYPLAQGQTTTTLPINSPCIWISTELINSETVSIRIRDNGTGIPEELRSRVFEPFFTTKPVGQGSGLGLSTSFQIIVDRHSGRLTYQSCPDQGTEFVIELSVSALKVT